MWWPNDNPQLAEVIDRLLVEWHEGRLPFVTAIGSTWTEEGDRTALVCVDARRDPRPWTWAPTRGPLDGVTRLLIQRYGPLPPFVAGDRARRTEERGGLAVREVSSAARLFLAFRALLAARRLKLAEILDVPGWVSVPLHVADDETRSALTRLEVPHELRVAYFTHARGASRPALCIFSRSRARATAGCILEGSDRALITTAGHLGAAAGEELYRRRSPWALWNRWAAIGSVRAVTAPDARDTTVGLADGVDIAVAEVDSGLMDGWQPIPGLADPQQLKRRDDVSWNGGRSGHLDGYVWGFEKEAEDPDIPLRHLITVIGKPKTLAGRKGDSGSAVFSTRGTLIGHQVGVDGARRRGLYQIAWVQDARIAFDYIEARTGPIQAAYGDLGQ